MRKFNKKLKRNLIGLGLISILGITGCSKSEGYEQSESTTKEVSVSKGDIKDEITLSGFVQASKLTSVNSDEKSIVSKIYVNTGEEVMEGEDIVLLESGNVIEAPYSGMITKISISEGDSIDTNSSVFNIADNSEFRIQTTVDESEVNKISVGQKVKVNISAIDKEAEGSVTSVDAQGSTSGNSVTFGVEIVLESDIKDLYSAMSCELSIVIKESKDTLVVPVQAVKSKGGKYTVNLKSNEEPKEVEVEIGLQNSSLVEIKSGLNEGDTVVYSQTTQKSSTSQGRDFNQNSNKDMMPPDINGMKGQPDGVKND